MSNTFGRLFRITSFGESHGPAVGVVIDGCPPGVALNVEAIQAELDRRRPGQSKLVTQRKEKDQVQVLSGVFEGQTTGTPIALLAYNEDARSKDYGHIKDIYRPSHADYTYQAKYGLRDYRGGGRASARETWARVAAGAVARQVLAQLSNIQVLAWVQQVGSLAMPEVDAPITLEQVEHSPTRCPHPETAKAMEALIEDTRKAGDSIGGIVQGIITGVPAGLGEPAFDKLHARLGQAMLSINAVKGFEYGSGFAGTTMHGSTHNDALYTDEHGTVRTRSNHSGGIIGGISNGMPITLRVAFKPTATIMQDQETVNEAGEPAIAQGRGRHDPCVLPRAVPIVEAMAALTLLDFLLLQRALTGRI